jgi:hypothetical protein
MFGHKLNSHILVQYIRDFCGSLHLKLKEVM